MRVVKACKPRSAEENQQLTVTVAEIIHQVRAKGDEALAAYNQKFDLNHRRELRIPKAAIQQAYEQLTEQDLADLHAAAANIRIFAEAQKTSLLPLENISPIPGLKLGQRIIPVQSCCCYVPGGAYPLFSSALMLVIPAKVAGVKRIAACSPARQGIMHPKVLAALDIAGADEIFAVGGAHGVAAFAYGTSEISPVDIIVGPGNQYVTEAKRQCYGQVGIDFLAGPSEVLVLADTGADPDIVAADLLAQSEHDPMAKGILVTTDEALAAKVLEAVANQLQTLPTAEIASRSWADYGEIVVVDDMDEAVDIVNDYAPEHLEIILQESEREQAVIENLFNYGALFIGKASAETFGDYVSGANHTLPTLKAARYTGGVWVGTFLKVCTHQRMELKAMQQLAPLVSRLARGEGLIAHAQAAERRAEQFNS